MTDKNVAGLIRTAEGFLVEEIVFERSPRLTPGHSMAMAVGTEKWQPWRVADPWKALNTARKKGYQVIALEQTTNTVPLWTINLSVKTCFVLGNERTGIPQRALDFADIHAEIPMLGFVNSFNVVTAGSMALYEWARQNL